MHVTKRARDLAQIDAELVDAAKAQERAIRAGDRPMFDAMTGLIDGLLDERHALLPRPRSGS